MVYAEYINMLGKYKYYERTQKLCYRLIGRLVLKYT